MRRSTKLRAAAALVTALIGIGGTALLSTPSVANTSETPSGLPLGGMSPQAMAMVRKYPQALTAARFYRGIEAADIRLYDRVLAPDWLDVPLLDGQGPGRAGFASVLKTYHAAFPNLRVHIDEIVVAGNTVTSRNTLTGNQNGPFLGVPATGRRVTFRTTDVHHLQGGLIKSSYHLEDLYGAYQQVTGKH